MRGVQMLHVSWAKVCYVLCNSMLCNGQYSLCGSRITLFHKGVCRGGAVRVLHMVNSVMRAGSQTGAAGPTRHLRTDMIVCNQCQAESVQCRQCGATWQWGGLCPECVRLEDKAISASRAARRMTNLKQHRTARGLHDHTRATATPRKQTGVN